MQEPKLLFSGLGGGLDIVNASIPYFAVKKKGRKPMLGTVRPLDIKCIENATPFASGAAMVDSSCTINAHGRYPEARVAGILGEEVLFFSRAWENGVSLQSSDTQRLRGAIEQAVQQFGFSHVVFVDGGGDSLILRKEDACATSETSDPFQGGDSESLAALMGIPNAYLGIVAVGLDISKEGFQSNLNMLKERGAYFGRVNLHTWEKDEYKLDHLIPFEEGCLEDFITFAEDILVLTREHCKPSYNQVRWKSHTAVVSYHAVKGHWGRQRTFVPWEPKFPDGSKGVDVNVDFAWMYFFDATQVQKLKLELNQQ